MSLLSAILVRVFDDIGPSLSPGKGKGKVDHAPRESVDGCSCPSSRP